MSRAMLLRVLQAPPGATDDNVIGIVADVVKKNMRVLRRNPLWLLIEEFDGNDRQALKDKEVQGEVYDPDYYKGPISSLI